MTKIHYLLALSLAFGLIACDDDEKPTSETKMEGGETAGEAAGETSAGEPAGESAAGEVTDCDPVMPEPEPEPEPEPDPIPTLVQPDGTYEVVPLEKTSIVLKVIQNSADSSYAANLARMVELGEEACTVGDKPDIILYHEFPITGYIYGGRESKLLRTIEVPGPESDTLAELARSCDAYVVFGAYARDDVDWPGHILSLSTVIGRDGEIVQKIWKPRNIKRFYSTFEITTTTVESVRTRFRELYGIDNELPVLRTEFGNIAVSSVQLDPLVFSSLAMKGAEIILRTATLYFPSDVSFTALSNNVFSAMANITDDSPYGGQSVIVDPLGEVMDQVESRTEEGIATARIPIAAFRANRRIPQITTEFNKEIFDQYVPEIPLDHLDLPPNELPETGEEMKSLFDRISRWLNP